jgi:hypothetical protein
MLTYDKLIEEALDSYRDYLEADERMGRLVAILDKLEGEVEDSLEEVDGDGGLGDGAPIAAKAIKA